MITQRRIATWIAFVCVVLTATWLCAGPAACQVPPEATTSASTHDAAAQSSSVTDLGVDRIPATLPAAARSSSRTSSDIAGLSTVAVAAETEEGAASSGALVKSGWPANGGFLGDPVETTLKPGTMIDRYGGPGGSYVSPKGTPFGQRGLPAYYENAQPYYQYQVVESVTVRGGTVAPAFGGGGGGVQYQFGTSIQDLIDSGVLKQVGP